MAVYAISNVLYAPRISFVLGQGNSYVSRDHPISNFSEGKINEVAQTSSLLSLSPVNVLSRHDPKGALLLPDR